MAGKQIGKLRQWAGEMLGSASNKGALTEDFKDLEHDVTLRSAGVERLSSVSQTYIQTLIKKSDIEIDAAAVKTLPVEALGLVMIGHGDEFGVESVYGQSLIKFGRAHCKVANIQEEFANTLTSTYIQSLEDQIGSIKEYQAHRKKLDSRRLTLDASLAKASKAKKDKDKAEAELEVEVARKRYDEISEEVQERMLSIQQHETKQLADLANFLKVEIQYVSKYQNTLLELQAELPDINTVSQVPVRRPQGGPHVFADLKPQLHTKRSNHRSPSSSPVRRSVDELAARHSLREERPMPQHSRAQSASSLPPRNRSDSATTSGSGYANGTAGKITGWVGSMTSRSRASSVSRKNFQELVEDDLERPKMSHSRPGSIRVRKPPPPPSSSMMDRYPSNKPGANNLVRVRALYDFFSTATGELEFHKGDIITLTDLSLTTQSLMDEDHDGWVDGELNGLGGLIPLSYTEVIKDDVASHDVRPSLERLHTRSTIKAKRSRNVFSDSEGGGNATASASSDEDDPSALQPNALSQRAHLLSNSHSRNRLNRRSTSSPELLMSPRDHASFSDVSYPSSPVDPQHQYHQQLLVQQFQQSTRNRTDHSNKYSTGPQIESSADEADTPNPHTRHRYDASDDQDIMLRAPQRRLSDLPSLDHNGLSSTSQNGPIERPALPPRVISSYRKPPPPPPPSVRPRASQAQSVVALGPPPPVPPAPGPKPTSMNKGVSPFSG